MVMLPDGYPARIRWMAPIWVVHAGRDGDDGLVGGWYPAAA